MSPAVTKPPLIVTLPPAESKYLTMAANGMTAKAIAKATNRGLETVRGSLENTRRRLYARNTTHAVAIAIRHGLIA